MLCLTRLRANACKVGFVELVKELRLRTEAPIAECSAALKETAGDVTGAMELLRRRGSARAVRKQTRVTGEGGVVACLAPPFGAALVSVCTETDFAARAPHFQRGCGVVGAALRGAIADTRGALLADPAEAHRRLVEATAGELQDVIAALGENVTVGQVEPLRVPARDEGHVLFGAYTHGTLELGNVGRIAGIVALRREEHADTQKNNSNNNEVEEGLLLDVARHFVACSGAEGNYAHQNFFGTDEPIGQWLRRHGLRFSSSLVMEFGKEPIVHTAAEPRNSGGN